MAAKAILVFCAQVLFIQAVFSQSCVNRAAIDASGIGVGAPYGFGLGRSPALAGPAVLNNGLAASGLAGRGLGEGLYSPSLEFTTTSGGSLPVTSTSAIAPTGISIVSENVFEGPLSVTGELPFVGTTGMEGAIPSTGAGAINHGCGNGVTAMVSDAAIAYSPGAAIPPIAATFPAAGIAPVAAGIAPVAAGIAPVAAGIAPVAATFGPAPLAGRVGVGCGGNVVY